MSQFKTIFPQTKTLFISALVISLAACSPGTETASSPPDSASSPPADSGQTATSTANVEPLGVKSVQEISFRPVAASIKTPNGSFDTVNGSSAPTIEVPQTNPINVNGWAVPPEPNKAADNVIITQGENNSLVTVAPINLARPDVAKTFNNPAYQNSGWSATIDPSLLSGDKVLLKAWAYNSATKQAYQLNPTHEIVLRD